MSKLEENEDNGSMIVRESHHSLTMSSESEETFQGSLVVSCSSLATTQLMQNITGQNSLPSPICRTFGENQVKMYPWHIDTKYYEADIYLCDVQPTGPAEISFDFGKNIQAIVIHFDNNDTESFAIVKSWGLFAKGYNPDVRILICDTASEDSVISRLSIQTWCIENEFELVEMHPEEEDEDDEDALENDFKESNSIGRVLQALHANVWPDMRFKENPRYEPSTKFKDLLSKSDSHSEPQTDSTKQLDESKVESLLKENEYIFDEIHHEIEEDPNSFEGLFARFSEMKEKAVNLTGDERRLYAEKVALAFWKALGGDGDEADSD